MKKVIAFLLCVVVIFALVGCREPKMDISDILIQSVWVSPDRIQVVKMSDDWTITYDNWSLEFYEDGSCKGAYTETSVYPSLIDPDGKFNYVKQRTFSTYWSIDGDVITLEQSLTNDIKLTFTEEHILQGPVSEGYTYVQTN